MGQALSLSDSFEDRPVQTKVKIVIKCKELMKPAVVMSVTLVTFPEVCGRMASAGYGLYECTQNTVYVPGVPVTTLSSHGGKTMAT